MVSAGKGSGGLAGKALSQGGLYGHITIPGRFTHVLLGKSSWASGLRASGPWELLSKTVLSPWSREPLQRTACNLAACCPQSE